MADPTVNELFRDAITRRQIYLQHYAQGVVADINRLLDGTEADVRAQMERRLANIIAEGGVDFGPDTTAKLQVLEEAIARIRGRAFDDASDAWDGDLVSMGTAEADFLQGTLQDMAPVKLDLVLPTAEALGAIVESQPFQGKVMADWAQKLQDDDIATIMDNIKIGLVQGDTTDEISRRVFGSAALDGADGAVQKTRYGVRAITQTAINHVANETRGAFYDANSDVVPMEVFVAVLDSHTTPICAALDGTEYPTGEGPVPPMHWNCRSTRVGVLDGTALAGERPANASVASDMEGMSMEEKAAYLDDVVGQVPALQTYEEFFANQTDAFQNEVLGPTRAALFRDGGLSLDRFTTRTGRLYTLEELQAAEPAAFRRAGV